MEPEKYVRRPKEVVAVRVTGDNVAEVARWCGGKIRRDSLETGTYIELPDSEYRKVGRTGRAYIGDWITFRKRVYLSYSNQVFANQFIKK